MDTIGTVQACKSCGEPSADDAKFCSQCGMRLRPSGDPVGDGVEERRHCTVMFCDLVESTSLSEELGPEGYKEVTDVVYGLSGSIIKRYGGEVFAVNG